MHVILKVAFSLKLRPAVFYFAVERPFIRMDSAMDFHVALFIEFLAAYFAEEGLGIQLDE